MICLLGLFGFRVGLKLLLIVVLPRLSPPVFFSRILLLRSSILEIAFMGQPEISILLLPCFDDEGGDDCFFG